MKTLSKLMILGLLLGSFSAFAIETTTPPSAEACNLSEDATTTNLGVDNNNGGNGNGAIQDACPDGQTRQSNGTCA